MLLAAMRQGEGVAVTVYSQCSVTVRSEHMDQAVWSGSAVLVLCGGRDRVKGDRSEGQQRAVRAGRGKAGAPAVAGA